MIAESGSTFAVMLQNAPTGLTGSLSVGIEDGDGNEVVAASTAGIVEIGGGTYVKDDLVAPVALGRFYIMWHPGGVDVPEELDVVASGAGLDYVTLDEIKRTLTLTGQSYADEDIALAITAASRAIELITGRKFWLDANASARKYTPSSARYLHVHDFSVLTSVTFDGAAKTQGTDYVLLPYTGPPWNVLRVYESKGYLPRIAQGVTITAKWGFVEPPADIKMAAKIMVARLFRRPREAAFGIAGLGVDAAVYIAHYDSDVALLLGGYKGALVPPA